MPIYITKDNIISDRFGNSVRKVDRPSRAKKVWLVIKVTWGGTTSHEIYARSAAANRACENQEGVCFAHAFEIEVK